MEMAESAYLNSNKSFCAVLKMQAFKFTNDTSQLIDCYNIVNHFFTGVGGLLTRLICFRDVVGTGIMGIGGGLDLELLILELLLFLILYCSCFS